MSYIGNLPTNVAFVTDQFNGDGSTVAFTTSVAPASTSSILVAITGVLQDPSTYSVSGTTLTFSAAPPSGTGNISVRYLGIPASGVTTTAYRTLTDFTATAGQTTFSVPSYTAGYIDVYRNGSKLGLADFTATNGTTVVLAAACNAGDLVETESFYVSSVLNAIPATAGAVNSTYITDAAVTQAKLGAGVAGNGPAFSVSMSASQTVLNSTVTKVAFDTNIYDTANCFSTSNYRFTPNIPGYYRITASVFAGTNSSSRPVIGLYKNGSAEKQMAIVGTANAGGSTSYIATDIYFNGSSDYVEVYWSQDTGSSVSINNSASLSYFQGFLARAA